MSRRRSVLVVVAIGALVAMGTALGVGVGDTASPAYAATTAGCGKAPTLTSGTRTIQSSGQNRTYILDIPTNYDRNRPYRLIFGLHWLNGTASNVATGGSDGAVWAFYGQKQLSNNGTIFVAPQGLNNGWANTNGQDITLMDNILAVVSADLCIETTQVYSMGWSYGGAMSYALACARPTVFRAVVVYSGAQLSGCNGGTQPVAYFGIHGTRDSVLNISSGRSLRDTFVRNNGCTAQNPREPAQNSLTHVTTAYAGCRAGYPVQWAAFDGDHTPTPVDGSTTNSGARTWTSAEVNRFLAQFQTSTTAPPTTTTRPPTTVPPTTVPPTTSPPPSGGQQIVGNGSGRCVDITGFNTNDGNRLQIYDCTAGWNQRWSYTNNTFVNPQSGKCLNVSGGGTGNGTAVNLWTCNGSGAQRWQLQSNGNIVNTQSGRCLDAVGRGTNNGTLLQIYDCVAGGQSNQQWTLR
jgi:poly(3-hydroxybutyrate) depolymerase